MARKKLFKVYFNEDELELLLDCMAYIILGEKEDIDDIKKNTKQRNSLKRMFKRMCNIVYEDGDDITLGTGYLGEGEWLYYPEQRI